MSTKQSEKAISVSVVIPTQNRVELLKRAVESALAQTYPACEIIVVSDGSTDGTDEWMQAWSRREPRIQYIANHPARGANHARNVGIRKSTSEYVAFLDDDDEWYPEKLELQTAKVASDKNIGMVCTAMTCINVEDNHSHIYIPPARYDSSREILKMNCIGSTTTAMVRRDILEQAGLFDEAMPACQDHDLWIRVCQLTKVGVVETPCLNYYNDRSGMQISSHTEKTIRAIEMINRKYANYFDKLTRAENRQRECYVNMTISKKGMRNGQKKIAISYAVKAFSAKPGKNALICLIAALLPYKFVMRLRSSAMKNGLN